MAKNIFFLKQRINGNGFYHISHESLACSPTFLRAARSIIVSSIWEFNRILLALEGFWMHLSQTQKTYIEAVTLDM